MSRKTMTLSVAAILMAGAAHAQTVEPAPMPNIDIHPVIREFDASKAARLTPTLFSNKDPHRGDGFSYGSTVQGNEEHQMIPAAGLSIKVPLH